MTKLRTLPPEIRRQRAREFVGKQVQVTTNVRTDGAYIGKAIAVAQPNTGSVADMFILQVEHPDPTMVYVFAHALSLATIDSIEVLTT